MIASCTSSLSSRAQYYPRTGTIHGLKYPQISIFPSEPVLCNECPPSALNLPHLAEKYGIKVAIDKTAWSTYVMNAGLGLGVLNHAGYKIWPGEKGGRA